MRLGGLRGIGRAHGDADVVLWELLAGEHLGPGEAKRLHNGGAPVSHCLAQPAARVDGPIQADWRKQGAQEHLGARVAVLVDQGHPAACLLPHLSHGLVLQKVGQQHLLVAHVVAQPQVVWDVHALRLLAIDAPAGVQVRLPAEVLVLCGPTARKQGEG